MVLDRAPAGTSRTVAPQCIGIPVLYQPQTKLPQASATAVCPAALAAKSNPANWMHSRQSRPSREHFARHDSHTTAPSVFDNDVLKPPTPPLPSQAASTSRL
ncbi:hypothetical protein CDEST_03134 [Colletotrichum destructivum]|uniref:Uncharacterized protein n=1 Tax=Colletotrichum destructivum TaxID=34406 RepID=A0AAX4I549_9PEZI|nr:hypothetical protein CDEST_03134 [Colletotrichum destructivum]